MGSFCTKIAKIWSANVAPSVVLGNTHAPSDIQTTMPKQVLGLDPYPNEIQPRRLTDAAKLKREELPAK